MNTDKELINALVPAGAIIVIKLGSSMLTSDDNQLDMGRLEIITRQVVELKRQNYKVVIVSSGAIACGMQRLGYTERPSSIVESSSAAAIGQALLMHNYEEIFRRDNYGTAQILLTYDGLQDRGRYLNARNTMLHLLEKKMIIPIVNENDAVVNDEIKFGDNDKLSALVATLIDANLLIILSDVDGVYDARGKVIEKISEIDASIIELAGGTSKKTTVGGMVTKIEAAKITTNAGIPMVIANGNVPSILRILAGERAGTWFVPKPGKMPGKKRWIAFSGKNCGKIIVDDGAQKALREKGGSLLAIGVVGLEGKFDFGDLVVVCDRNHQEIARGLTNYTSREMELIKGRRTPEIEKILGYKSYDEVIHRDNMVVLQ